MNVVVGIILAFLACCLGQDLTQTESNHRNLALADESFDFKPFRDAIAKVVNKPFNAAKHTILPNSTSLDCVYPYRTVIFTYSTHYTRELILMQHQALETSGLRSCLEEIMVTLCLDKKCVDYCEENKIENVALVEMGAKSKSNENGANTGTTAAELPPSDFNKGEYRFLTYLKQELFYEALQVADSFFFMDVDCLLFKNPFIEIQYGRDELGHRIVFEESMSAESREKAIANGVHVEQTKRQLAEENSYPHGLAFIAVKKNDPSSHPDKGRSLSHPGPGVSEHKRKIHGENKPSGGGGDHRKNLKDYNYPDRYGYDLMYQRDRGRTLDCSGSVNTGQVYMRNSTRAQLYFKRFRELKGVIMEGKNGPEQDYVYEASRVGNMRICSLTPHLFTAHCYIDFGNIRYINNGRTPIRDIISYHVSCVEGLGLKKRRLMDVFKAVKEKSGEPMANFL